jgi:hypothetical protein
LLALCEFDPPSRVCRVKVVLELMSVRKLLRKDFKSAEFANCSMNPATAIELEDSVAGVVGMP